MYIIVLLIKIITKPQLNFNVADYILNFEFSLN